MKAEDLTCKLWSATRWRECLYNPTGLHPAVETWIVLAEWHYQHISPQSAALRALDMCLQREFSKQGHPFENRLCATLTVLYGSSLKILKEGPVVRFRWGLSSLWGCGEAFPLLLLIPVKYYRTNTKRHIWFFLCKGIPWERINHKNKRVKVSEHSYYQL